METGSVSEHYQSGEYDEHYRILFGDNRKRVAELIGQEIAPSHHTIADIGGGTGDTIDKIKALFAKFANCTFLLVEPCKEMADKAKQRPHPPDRIILSTGNAFAKEDTTPLDIVLLQEVIHHIEDLPNFFSTLFNRLNPGGKIIIVTRPAEEIEFPFGTHGKKSWKDSYNQDPTEYVGLLEKAGFLVSPKIVSLPIQVEKAQWLEMVGDKPVFSNISALTKKQRAEDLRELQALPPRLSFSDKQYFVIARKPPKDPTD